jgi:hypothetical protein
VTADVLSSRTDATVGAPLITQGFGDAGSALWRSSLQDPRSGTRPFVWRMPEGRG